MAKPILGFKSQKDCKAAVRAEVDPHRTTGLEFTSELVSDLLANHHYGCMRHGLRPVAFKWGTHPVFKTDECFYGRFNDPRFPLLWWRHISWNKAIKRWRLSDETLDAELDGHYRRRSLQAIFDHRDRYPRCEWEGCNSADQVDVHHCDPTFKEIADAATALLSAEERANLIASHDWLNDENWIPDKCARYVVAAHATVKLMSLCKSHHYKIPRVTNARRNSGALAIEETAVRANPSERQAAFDAGVADEG